MPHYADREMSDPRFTPRRYTTDPDLFGKARVVGWQNDLRSVHEQDRLAAAQMQHDYAFEIRRRVREQYKSMNQYAQAFGVSYDRLAKVMRGDAIMRLEDIAQAERLLGNFTEQGLHFVVPTEQNATVAQLGPEQTEGAINA